MQRQRPALTPVKSSPQLGKYPQGVTTESMGLPTRAQLTSYLSSPSSTQTHVPTHQPHLAAPSAPSTAKRPKTRAGSADEPDDHYIEVPLDLYCHIPARSHIIYKKIGGDGQYYGGFVKAHHKTTTGYMTIIAYGVGDKATTYPLAHENVEKMWKKYYEPAFIELFMSRNALVRRRVDVEKLSDQVKQLSDRVKQLEGVILNSRRV